MEKETDDDEEIMSLFEEDEYDLPWNVQMEIRLNEAESKSFAQGIKSWDLIDDPGITTHCEGLK